MREKDKGEVIKTEKIANKTPDDGIPNKVEVNKAEETADFTPAAVDVSEKPDEGDRTRLQVVGRLQKHLLPRLHQPRQLSKLH